MNTENILKVVEDAIKTTLVISNPQSIKFTIAKIEDYLTKQAMQNDNGTTKHG